MDLENWFLMFWETYPADLTGNKKGPKSVCKKNVLKLNPNEELQNLIMNRLREWIRHCRAEKKLTGKTDRWPFGSTWISQERWCDFVSLESSTDMRERAAGDSCECGKPRAIKKLCWDCYDAKSDDVKSQKEYLYAHLTANGLAKKRDETYHEYCIRCRDWGVKSTSLGKLQSLRQAVYGGLE